MSTALFSIASSALTTHQRVLETISQNIANAETPGYSRQEAVIEANVPVRTPQGMVGTGVHVAAIIRKRDLLLDNTFRNVAADSGAADVRRDNLTGIENIFGEPTDAGMTSALDDFSNSWSDLASTPSNDVARQVVLQRGVQVASLLNSYDTSLTEQRTASLDRLGVVVSEINGMAERIAKLNIQISSNENGSGEASDLRDERDKLIDDLATKAGATSAQQSNGTMAVYLGTSALVDGSTFRTLTLDVTPTGASGATTDTPASIRLGNSLTALKPLGGAIASLVETINTSIPTLRSRLDGLAASIVSSVNAVHVQGYTFTGNTLPGTPAGDFFDPGAPGSPVTAATIRIGTVVSGDFRKIAASKDPMAPLDNQLANQMSSLRNDPTTVTYNNGTGTETASFLGFFRSTVTQLGLDVRNATDNATVATALAEQADGRRESVSGVNTDEELVHMLRTQQAYVAATKLIKTADEMMQTILNLIG